MPTRRTRRRRSLAGHSKPSGGDGENEDDDGDDDNEDASPMSRKGHVGRGSREEDGEIAGRDASMPAAMFSTPDAGAVAAAAQEPLELLLTSFYSSSSSSLSPSSLAVGGAGWRKLPLARGGAGFLAASSRFSNSAVAMSTSDRKNGGRWETLKRRLEIGEK